MIKSIAMNASSKSLAPSCIFMLLLALSGASLANNAEEIRYRVQKVGKLNISTEAATPDKASNAQANVEAPKTTAADLYQTRCFACHGTGAANAPILGDKAAWEARIAKGADTLLINAINGFNAMPPRGGTSLEDDKIELIVTYIIENSQ